MTNETISNETNEQSLCVDDDFCNGALFCKDNADGVAENTQRCYTDCISVV